MTQPKYVAKSLVTLLENPMVKDTLDRTSDILDTARTAQAFWGYDLMSRKPSPAYNEYGVFTGTNLDLACFLYALVGREAVINIPRYKAGTKTTLREDQKLASKENRHGRLVGVLGNQKFFKFNIKIIDENVIGEDKVGDFRTFSLTGHDGNWYDGWDRIEFVPTLNENKFITENKLWTGSTIYFENFIHPNRWTSFFGHHYVISKLIIERLTEETSNLNSQIKLMLSAGITFPSEKEAPKSYDGYTYGETKSMSFESFEAKIFIPELNIKGEYPRIKKSQANLVSTYEKKKELSRIKESLMFMTRATELAHYKAPTNMPAWIQNTKWEDDFVEPGKRIKWQRLKLFQPEVGKHAVSILKRVTQKSTQVSPDF
jgi:hypothetical protein